MRALDAVRTWACAHAAAAVVTRDGVVDSIGDPSHVFRLASITKVVTAWAVLVGVEEATLDLDDEVGPPGATMRHCLAHAAGYPFEGRDPIAAVGSRRIYSNTGIVVAAEHLAECAGMAFQEYLAEAVLKPLAMTDAQLRATAAEGLYASVGDVSKLLRELLDPTLISVELADEAVTTQFEGLGGIVPGVGRFDPCPWGLGFEIRGDKSPHWTGRNNSPATFGHFGGSGTMMWTDQQAGVGLVALTDRPFDDWHGEVLTLWPALSDAVLDEFGSSGPRPNGPNQT